MPATQSRLGARLSGISSFFNNGIFASFFGFNIHKKLAALLQKGGTLPAADGINLASLGLMVIEAIGNIIQWVRSANRNWSKTTNVLMSVGKVAAIGTGIIGAAIGATAIAAALPFIMAGVMAFQFFYHGIKAIVSAIKARRTHGKTQQAYKQLARQNLYATIVAAIFTVAVVGLMISPAGPILMPLLAAGAALISLVNMIKQYRHMRQPPQTNTDVLLVEEDLEANVDTDEAALAELKDQQPVQNHWHQYHEQKHRADNLSRFTTIEKAREYLQHEIDSKVDALIPHRDQARGLFKSASTKKHAHKIILLEMLKDFMDTIKNDPKKQISFGDAFETFCKDKGRRFSYKLAFQSFFKEKGDVEDIFEAVHQWYQNVNTGMLVHAAKEDIDSLCGFRHLRS